MIEHRSQDGVLSLTLNRPERGNALGPDLVEALLSAVQTAFDNREHHTLLLRGAGRHFCTGLDLSDLDQSSDGEMLLRLVRIETLLSLIWQAPLRTVAVAQGRAWGAGADLFACCERRVASADASFRFPGAQFGIVLGTRRLAERVGVDRARQIVLEGGQWDARQATAAGLVTELAQEPPMAVGGSGLAHADPCQSAAAQPGQPPAVQTEPLVDATTAQAIRAATRLPAGDADLAALVRSASVPGLRQRMQAYRARQMAARPT